MSQNVPMQAAHIEAKKGGIPMPLPPARGHDTLCIGFEAPVAELSITMTNAFAEGFDYVVYPLDGNRHTRTEEFSPETALARSDLLLSVEQWTQQVVGRVSEWINPDSPNLEEQTVSEEALKREIAWATHLGLPAVLAPTPRANQPNYARILNNIVNSPHLYTNIWIRIPMVTDVHDGTLSSGRAINNPWEWWNTLRTMCCHSTSLSVCLEITADLPTPSAIDAWMGEPVRAAILPTSLFIPNSAGCPVLSRIHQAVLTRFMEHKIQIVLTGETAFGEAGMRPYTAYIQHINARRPPPTGEESFSVPYLDYLQAPLQPLMDNLESQTYELFEKDPQKYILYEEAVYRALMDRSPSELTVVMVVGAGRGPLVQGSLRAGERSGRPISVYAVEKNPNAVITLHKLKAIRGWDTVTIISSDMRDWEASEKADILVSELLGSWGDNELSPECLDGAQRFLKEGGISIPSSYQSYIAPLQSSKLYNEMKQWSDVAHHETGYVVKFHNVAVLSEPLPCFMFEHPSPKPGDNNRFTSLSFTLKSSAMVHGFAGYFEATLYKDVVISILPRTHTPGMFSWFPLYIPITEPLYVPDGGVIEAHFWRRASKQKVWYEWTVTSPDVRPISNPNGRSWWIGL